MTESELLRAAHAIYAPYLKEAERLGFVLLEENAWDWEERGIPGHSVSTFLYRAPTFLDFYTTVLEGAVPPGILPGFGGVQLYTFVGTPHLDLLLTNGSPPHAPRSLLGSFFDRIMKVPEDHQTYEMRNGAADLQHVLARHARVIGHRTPLVPSEPQLEQRWRWMEAIEREPETCC